MNKEHPNIEVLKKFNPANVAAATEILAEDIVLHYFNQELPQLEGDYTGHKGFMGFFDKLASLSTGSFKVNPISLTPIGDELLVSHVINTMVLGGRQMAIDAVVVWRIVDGKIKEVWDIPAVNTVKVS